MIVFGACLNDKEQRSVAKILASLRQLTCFLMPALASLELSYWFTLIGKAEPKSWTTTGPRSEASPGELVSAHTLGNISNVRKGSPVSSSSLLFSVILYSSDKGQFTKITGHGLLRFRMAYFSLNMTVVPSFLNKSLPVRVLRTVPCPRSTS